MRNQAGLLLLLSLFAVTFSRDLHKRYANVEDGALLDAFVRAVEDGKVDVNDLVQKDKIDLNKRWWFSIPRIPIPSIPWPNIPQIPGIPVIGKK